MKILKKVFYNLISLGLFLPYGLVLANGVTGMGIRNPIGVNNIQDLIAAALQVVVAVGTPIAVLFLIYTGFQFVVARGNPGEIDKAKQNFMYTIIGIVILLGAEVLSQIVKGTITQLERGL